ncbi:MAG TPA: DUF4179 domain-containing protein [Bacillales bacterium]|nr:DUF4179 domain-containing protein [Bacillales bacterium]
MNSQFPDFKNDMDKIPVPTEKLDTIILNTIYENRNKKSKKKIAFYSLSAAVVGFGLFIGSASYSPTLAKIASNIPIIGTFFNNANDEGLRIAGKKGLTQVVNQTAKDNGITLTLNEIFYDGTRLTFGFTQESLLPTGRIERPTIEVNGKEINFSSGYSGEFVTPQKYKMIMDITPTEELPEEFDMKMRIDSFGLIPGKWEFSVPVKQSNEVIVIRPQEVKTIEGAEVEISSLKIGPAGTDLNVKVVKDRGNNKLDPFSLNFYVIDENGHVLDSLTGSGSGEVENGKEVTALQSLYSPLKEGIQKVKVVPYTIPMTGTDWEEVTVSLDKQSLPFILDQGEFGKVLITDITYQNDRMVLYFDVQSDSIVDNMLSRNSIWLEDATGKSLVVAPERIKGNSFKAEFPTGKKKGLLIKTMKYPKLIMYEQFEIDIP